MAPKTTKRKHMDSDPGNDSDSDFELRTVSGFWPRWLLLEPTDEKLPLHKLAPWGIERGFTAIAGKMKTIKKLNSGALLAECTCKMHSDQLLKSQMFVNCPIKVSAHRTLNSTKGVIRCRDLRGVSELEIKTELASQGVTDVYRVTVRKGSERVPTDTLFLTFCTPDLPQAIKVGYLNVQVSLFVPSPIRCYKCQKFGHVRDRCPEKEESCGTCLEAMHDGPCQKQPLCANCGGSHPSSSKVCPSWKVEQEIQRVKAERKVPFFEAKKIVEATLPVTKVSYASVVSQTKKVVSVECQTDLCWVTGEIPKPYVVKKSSETAVKTVGSQASQQSGSLTVGQPEKSVNPTKTDKQSKPVAVRQPIKPTAPSKLPVGQSSSDRRKSPVRGPPDSKKQGPVEVVEVPGTSKPSNVKHPSKFKGANYQGDRLKKAELKIENRFAPLSDPSEVEMD